MLHSVWTQNMQALHGGCMISTDLKLTDPFSTRIDDVILDVHSFGTSQLNMLLLIMYKS